MALTIADRVKVVTTTAGTGTLTLGAAATGFQDFSVIGDGNTTYYTITIPGGSDWEVGIGTYTASGTTLSRDTILASSNSGSVVNLPVGTKDVFVTYPSQRSVISLDGNNSEFTSGTVMLFYQATAPTGWSQVTTVSGGGSINEYALRVVSGTGGGIGGNVNFNTAFTNQTANGNIAVANATAGGNISVDNTTAGGNISVANTTAGGNISVANTTAGGNVSVGSTTLTTSQVPNATGSFTQQGNRSGVQQASGIVSAGATNTGSASPSSPQVPLTFFVNLGFGGGSHNHSGSFSGNAHSHNASFTGSAHLHNASFTGNAHNHTGSFTGSAHLHNASFTGDAINLAVKYVDLIVCSKS